MIPIAFGHRKRVGKDTASKFLISGLRTLGSRKQINKGSFAYELKKVAHNLYGWAGVQGPDFYEQDCNAHLRETVVEGIGLTVREIWIELGMKMRDIYSDTWVDVLLHNNDAADILIISDCRFPNECERIQAKGGFVIKIDRPSIEKTSDEADDALEGWEGWDYTITNDGTLDQFYRSVIKMAEDLHLK